MIDRIIGLSIAHRGVVIAASLALAVAGLFAVWSVPMDASPIVRGVIEVDRPTLS